MKMKIIIFIGKILMVGGRINLVAQMLPIKMQQGDLFMILRWPADFIRSRASIIKISAAISAFLLKNILDFNALVLKSVAAKSVAAKRIAAKSEVLKSNKITHTF